MHRYSLLKPAVSALTICLLVLAARSYVPANREQPVTVTVDTTKPANRFIPSQALGAGVDGHELGETERQLSPANITAMRSAGLRPLTYRLRTELAGEAWHWNPKGTWSDAAHRQGYWTPIEIQAQSNFLGYRLPRRGNTIDQPTATGTRASRRWLGLWKSKPCLDNASPAKIRSTPQWVSRSRCVEAVSAIRILWAHPLRRSYRFSMATVGGRFVAPPANRLFEFPRGNLQCDCERRPFGVGTAFASPYVRLRLDESSGTSPRDKRCSRPAGLRDSEIYLGTIDSAGRFHDVVRHATERNKQTAIYVSSTDPWHRAIDHCENTEQPGFDFIFSSGLTNGLPMLLPAPVLYDTPENAAAEIRYLTARGYPIDQVEMGEEADGQFVDAEHYAQLYLQFVDALRRANPRLHFGGPSMQDIEQTQVPGRIEFGKGGWLRRFLEYLKSRDRLRFFVLLV